MPRRNAAPFVACLAESPTDLHGPRARALRDKVDGVIKADAFKPLTERPRKATETEGAFPAFASWLSRRFDEQWETTDVMSEIADYGKVQWNGRTS